MTYEKLYHWYVTEELSLRQVAERAGKSAANIRYHMKRLGIPRRTKSEALSGSKNPMHGRTHTPESRQKISETLGLTNEDPEVQVRRSAGVSGNKNPMYGHTHTVEVREASRQRLEVIRAAPGFQAAHLEAMGRPEVRRALSEAASQRVGARNPFFGKQHTQETLDTISLANRGRFQGARGSNWQGGKTRLTTLIRNSEPAIRWRKAVFERDSFTCQACSKVGGDLNADHIRPLALLLAENGIKTLEDAFNCLPLWDLSNGRTLCVSCHKLTPSFAGNFQKNYKMTP